MPYPWKNGTRVIRSSSLPSSIYGLSRFIRSTTVPGASRTQARTIIDLINLGALAKYQDGGRMMTLTWEGSFRDPELAC